MTERTLKRALDIVLAGSALIAFSPILLAIALAIRVSMDRRSSSARSVLAARATPSRFSSSARCARRPMPTDGPSAARNESPGSAASSVGRAWTSCRSCGMSCVAR